MGGKAIIVSAPSGAGKTTMVRHLLASGLGLEFSISACSRPRREHEVNGVDYYFINACLFREMIRNGDFIEWEEVYEDHYYGTLRSELDRIWEKGNHIIFDVDVEGGRHLKKILGEKALSLFIMPPSVSALEERLRKRSTENETNLARRLGKARKEMKKAGEFDRIIVNDDLPTALNEAVEVVRNFLTLP